jgi:hypothetical protein
MGRCRNSEWLNPSAQTKLQRRIDATILIAESLPTGSVAYGVGANYNRVFCTASGDIFAGCLSCGRSH